MRVKYDDSINQNNFLIRKILIVGFDSIKNHNSYLFLIKFPFLIYSILFFVLSLRIKYDDNKN